MQNQSEISMNYRPESVTQKPAKLIKIFGVMIFAIIIQLGLGCPNNCESCDKSQLFCDKAGHTIFPSDIPKTVYLITLNNNNMTLIPDTALSKHKNHLKTLCMMRNRLNSRSLGHSGLHQLSNLETLMLDHNRFESIRRQLFAGMSQLKLLSITYNYISLIDRDAFAEMSQLVEIKLTGNRLINVPQLDQISSLQRLYLDSNNISKIKYSFRNLHALIGMTLADNELEEIPEDSFGRTDHLSKFNISGNKLRKAPPIIRNLTELISLDMSRNPITDLPEDLLEDLHKIKNLDISRMRLRNLKSNFIPLDVALNTVQMAFNPWLCDCDIKPVVEWNRHFSTVDSDLSRCASPRKMSHHLIRDLDLYSLGCEEFPRDFKHSSSLVTSSSPKTTEDCLLRCQNGGSCNQNICRCTVEWTGPHCDLPVMTSPPVSVTSSTSTTNDLVIQEEMISERSVTVLVPRINYKYRLSITTSGGFEDKREIFPHTRTYKIKDLLPGTLYRICLGSLQGFDDQLCSVVSTRVETTSRDAPVTSDDKTSASTPNYITNDQEAILQKSEVRIKSENSGSVMYPIVGGGIGIFVILVLAAMFYSCQKKRKRLGREDCERKHPSTDPQIILEQEMIPLASDHKQTFFDANILQPNTTTNYHQIQPSNQSITSNSSLTRSSVSGGSIVGHVVDKPPTNYLTNTNIYPISSVACYKMNNNRTIDVTGRRRHTSEDRCHNLVTSNTFQSTPVNIYHSVPIVASRVTHTHPTSSYMQINRPMTSSAHVMNHKSAPYEYPMPSNLMTSSANMSTFVECNRGQMTTGRLMDTLVM